MTVQYSTTVRNNSLDSWEDSIGPTPIIEIRTGAQPANCGAASTGTLLATYTLASDWATAASGGSKSLANLPLTTTAVATGTAAHYRLFASDGTTCHDQGSVTVTGGGGDMTIDNASIVSGQTVNITAFTKSTTGWA